MKLPVLLLLAIVVTSQLFAEGDAACCRTTKFTIKRKSYKLCNDCTEGTPYCAARGRCNIVGCNCDGGCKEGFCFGDTRLKRSLRSLDAHDVIRAADVDGDDRMSLEEARAQLADLGLSDGRVKRGLIELDVDGDGYLAAYEIDSEFQE